MAAYDAGLNALDWMNRRALAGSRFSEETAESPVGRQTYYIAGSGAPLMLLHGAGDHAGSWYKTAPVLLASGRYRVIVPDLAGRGTSAPFAGPLGMDTLLAGLDAVADRAVPEPAILVGNSMGAWLAAVWSGRHPQRVARIVAVNGGPITGFCPDLTLTPADREQARRLWQAMMDERNWAVPDMVLDELIRKGREGALSRVTVASLQRELMDDRLDEIATPVDLVWGESDKLLPLEYARKLQAELPAARLTTIPGCGHVPHLECPDAFNTVLQSVLEQPPPGGRT